MLDGHKSGALDAGVVEGEVEPPKTFHGARHKRLHLFGLRNIGPHENGLAAGGLDQPHSLLTFIDAPAGDDYLGALRGKSQ